MEKKRDKSSIENKKIANPVRCHGTPRMEGRNHLYKR